MLSLPSAEDIARRIRHLEAAGWTVCMSPLFPRQTIGYGRTTLLGTTLRRRKRNPTFWSCWDYIQLPESQEEWEARQW